MAIVEYQQEKQNEIFENYKEVRLSIYQDLVTEFESDINNWDIEITPDLAVKFTNEEILFAQGSDELTPRFKAILTEFAPRYLNVLLQDQYIERITEIRIEGHTDTVYLAGSQDSYINNMQLSQSRARNVLSFIRNSKFYTTQVEEVKKRLLFLFTANGLSFGRTLDADKKLTISSGKPASNATSRRVEFRIVTNSHEVVNEIISKLENK